LIAKEGAPFAAQILGGGQERGTRAGTQNVVGIAGFGAAAEASLRGLGSMTRIAFLRDRFEHGLKQVAPEAIVFGETRLVNTSNFALPGITAETAVIALDLDGVMVSSGAACSSGKVKPSHVLKAMGVSEELARSALRISFGWNSTDEDADVALASLHKLVSRDRSRAAA
jgi:cysteine desulfurase